MQLQTLGKGRFEAQWSEDKHLIEKTIRDCICTRRIFDENEKLLTQGEHVENLYLGRFWSYLHGCHSKKRQNLSAWYA